MLNYTDEKIKGLLSSPDWDDHTGSQQLGELLEGWKIVGMQLLKNKEGYTTDCIFILEEPTGKIRALNVSNPPMSFRGQEWGTNDPIRIELERLPGEPPLMRPRELVETLGRLTREGKLNADERQEWYIAGTISRTEYEAIEEAAAVKKYEPSLRELAKAGLWSDLFRIAESSRAALALALKIGTEHAQEIDPEEWRDFVILAANMNILDPRGKDLRAALETLPKNGATDLPEEYRDEVIEVYQITYTITELGAFNLGEVPLWTYDKNEAIEVYNKVFKGNSYGAKLYRGKLNRADIIGVVPGVPDLVQLDSVYDIELIEAENPRR